MCQKQNFKTKQKNSSKVSKVKQTPTNEIGFYKSKMESRLLEL